MQDCRHKLIQMLTTTFIFRCSSQACALQYLCFKSQNAKGVNYWALCGEHPTTCFVHGTNCCSMPSQVGVESVSQIIYSSWYKCDVFHHFHSPNQVMKSIHHYIILISHKICLIHIMMKVMQLDIFVIIKILKIVNHSDHSYGTRCTGCIWSDHTNKEAQFLAKKKTGGIAPSASSISRAKWVFCIVFTCGCWQLKMNSLNLSRALVKPLGPKIRDDYKFIRPLTSRLSTTDFFNFFFRSSDQRIHVSPSIRLRLRLREGLFYIEGFVLQSMTAI
jgi:hypothetical protein